MSRGINKVILIGHLGRDPELRYSPSGSAVAQLKLATTETWKDKQTGKKTEKTEWHTISLFNRLAEIANEYLRKGSKVYIEGSLRTRKWQDKKTGEDKYSTVIVASELQMLDGKSKDSGDYRQQPDESYTPPASSPLNQQSQDIDDQEIPF